MAADDDPLLSLHARRRLLVALGYGAANVALAGLVGWRARPADLAPATSELVDLTASVRRGIPPAMADAAPQPRAGHRYDIVIANGRVIDPETGFDARASVGIDGSVVTALTTDPLDGSVVIDATGRVVAPGFIDLLSYEPNTFGVWYKLADGVTSNLAMHGISNYPNAYFDRYEGASPVHFGGAFHQHFMRAVDIEAGVEDELTPAQLQEFERALTDSLEQGFAGVSFSPEYAPGTTTEEMIALTEVAVDLGHMAFFHTRYSDPYEPGTSQEGLEEVLDVARRTGSAVHIEHLTSTGGTFVMPEALALLEQARGEGIDVTACVYPYDFWGTFLASSRFAAGWQDRFGLGYGDLQIAGTERRLSEGTYRAALDDNVLVAALGSIPEHEVQLALTRSWVMIGSDAILEPALNNHPRGAGTFARTIARYVRELGLLDLPEALAKMTILPARRVEAMIPAMARKGRMQRGADADIVVFDAETISDRATVAAPDQASVGIDWVLVGGQVALREGTALRDVRAGQALKSATR